MAKKQQDGLHLILKPIRYHGEGGHYRKRITPDDGILLPFSHLTDSGYALLIKKRVIAPATAEDAKRLKEAAAQREASKTDKQKNAEAARAAQKAAALAKQLKQDGDE